MLVRPVVAPDDEQYRVCNIDPNFNARVDSLQVIGAIARKESYRGTLISSDSLYVNEFIMIETNLETGDINYIINDTGNYRRFSPQHYDQPYPEYIYVKDETVRYYNKVKQSRIYDTHNIFKHVCSTPLPDNRWFSQLPDIYENMMDMCFYSTLGRILHNVAFLQLAYPCPSYTIVIDTIDGKWNVLGFKLPQSHTIRNIVREQSFKNLVILDKMIPDIQEASEGKSVRIYINVHPFDTYIKIVNHMSMESFMLHVTSLDFSKILYTFSDIFDLYNPESVMSQYILAEIPIKMNSNGIEDIDSPYLID